MYDRSLLALKLKSMDQEKTKENLRNAGGGHGNQYTGTGGFTEICEGAKIDTKKEFAKVASVSHDTIHKGEIALSEIWQGYPHMCSLNNPTPKNKNHPVRTAGDP